MHLPPSTGKSTPVMNFASSDARKTAALATSTGSVSRCSGIDFQNCSRFSGVSSTPTNDEKSAVPDSSGQMALKRIWSAPYSAARPLVA